MSIQVDEYTFEGALASKPADREDLTDAQWYVALVAWWTNAIEGLQPKNFRFCICPPNPEIQSLFDQRIPPHHAAITLFDVRH